MLQSALVKELIACEVCSQLLDDPRVLPCQHSFCLRCVETVLRGANRTGSLRCPTCRSIAAVPLGGVSHFPIDKKVDKVRELVDELLIQSIINKSIKDDLSDSVRSSSSSSSPAEFRGSSAAVDDLYGSHGSMYSSSGSLNTPRSTAHTQTDISWEDLSVGELKQNGDAPAQKQTSPRRRRRRPKPVREGMEEEDKPLLIIEETPIVKTMEDGVTQVDNGIEPEQNDQAVEKEEEEEETDLVNCDNNAIREDSDQQDGGDARSSQEDGDPIKENMLYELSPALWEAAGFDYNIPSSLAFLSSGVTVVAEYGNSHLQFFSVDGKLERSCDEVKPFSVFVDAEDRILVGDRREKTLRIFDSDGEQITQWESDMFKWISGIAVTSHYKYFICEREKCKIGIYEPDGTLVKEFGSHGANDTQFSMADFLAVDSHDRIIICDSANHCLKVYDDSGKFLCRFGQRGNRNGDLEWPKSVCIDGSDNILVTDQRNNRVSMFSPDGQFIQHLILDYPQPYAIAVRSGNPSMFGLTRYDLMGSSTVSVFNLNDRQKAGQTDNN